MIDISIITIDNISSMYVSSIPLGFVLGFLPMILGVLVNGLFKIINRA